MDAVRRRIKTTSIAIVAILGFIALLSGITVVLAAKGLLAGTLTPTESLDLAVWLARQALLTVLIMYTASIFLRIRREETPFFKQLPRKIKTAGILLFVAMAVPQWVGYAVNSVATGHVGFAMFDETNTLALGLALVVYCFGQIFEYGFLVQDENYEII